MFEDDDYDDRTLWERLQDFGISIHFRPFKWYINRPFKWYINDDINGDICWSFRIGPFGLTVWLS